MTDTHTHLYLPEFEDGGAEAVDRALAAGISWMIFPNVNAETIGKMRELHFKFPGATSMAIGLHPTDVKDDWEEAVNNMVKEAEKGEYVAIGEIGMDLYWDKTYVEFQKSAFTKQLTIAQELTLPVIIHCRQALDETLESITKIRPTVPLIFHSFTGGIEDVKKIRNICDPYFGINGVVTYKNARQLQEAVPEIGIERIVLETDSPYLTPAPYRGKRNESSYLSHICKKTAELLGISESETEFITDKNARRIFLGI